MATITNQSLSKRRRLRRTRMTVTGRINWNLPSEGHLNGGILVVSFRGEDPGPDESRHGIAVWVSRGRTRSSTDQYVFQADTADGAATDFRMVVRNHRLNIGGVLKRRFNEDAGKDEIYAFIVLQNVAGEPAQLSNRVRTNTVTGWF